MWNETKAYLRDVRQEEYRSQQTGRLLVKRGSDQVTVKKRVARWENVADLADGLANDGRECLKYLNRGAKALYQFPIVIAIFLEGPFSFM